MAHYGKQFMKGVLFLPLIILFGCGEDIPKKTLALMEANQFSEATQLAQDGLKANPDNSFYHGIMAEALTQQCVRENCPKTSPEKLNLIREHLSHTDKPVALNEETTLDFYKRLIPIIERFISIHNAPQSYAEFVRTALPEKANKGHFMVEIESFAKQAMSKGDFEGATKLLENISMLGAKGSPSVVLSQFILSYVRDGGIKNAELQAEMASMLEQNPKEAETFVTNLPHLIVINTRKTTSPQEDLLKNYVRALETPFSTIGLQSLNTPRYKAILADELFALSQDDTFLAQLIAQNANETLLTDARLDLLKMGLIHNPMNEDIWNMFFSLALDRIDEKNGSLRFIYNGLDLAKIPANVVINNNTLLIDKARKELENNQDITPLLQEVIYRSDANQAVFDEQVRSLLDTALNQTLEAKNYSRTMNYLRMIPEQPDDKKEVLKSTLEDALDAFWENNAFNEMEQVVQYMRNKLGASINLDVELMEYLRAYLDSDVVKSKLRATTPEPLLQPIEQARLDLGPKMTYIRQRFSGRPEIIQARLKALAINLEGAYSTANVLHSLRHIFTDENIDDLIANALKSSMANDDALSALDFAIYGEKFMKIWPGHFTINFIVSESMERVKNVEESREIWKKTSQKFHNFAEKLRPQLVMLLDGIKLFDAGEKEKAAEIFTKITDPIYKKEAQPYLDKFGSLISLFKGSYLYQGQSNNSPVSMVSIDRTDEILTAEVVVTSHLGVMEREKDLVKDLGKVSKERFTAIYNTQDQHLNFAGMEEALGNLENHEARTFSRLSHLSKEGDTLYVHLKNNEKFLFKKISDNARHSLSPDGTYGILRAVETPQQNNFMLPVGSILNFETEQTSVTREIQDIFSDIVKVKDVRRTQGTLRHPGTATKISFTGFYDEQLNILNFEYDYSLDGSNTPLQAVVRCQPLLNRITCAGHNKHEKRKRFMTIMAGRKVE